MTIYVDTSSQSLVVSPNDIRRCLPPNFTAGDTIPITLAFLERNPQPINTGQPVFNYVDMDGADIVLSFGPFGAAPTAGSFQLTFGADTTAALAWNISQYDLEVELNALASVTTAGGVNVLGPIGGPWQIAFIVNGARTAMASPANALFPASSVTAALAQVGTANNPAIQVVTLGQLATATIDSWTPQTSPSIGVIQIQANVIQRITIPPGTYGGTFTLTINGSTTAAIPWNAQIDVMTSAIAAIPGITSVSVWPGQNYWDITIANNTDAFTGNAAGLIVPLTLSGTLDLTSQAVRDLCAGSDCPTLVPFLIQATDPTTLTFFDYLARLSLPN